MDYLSILKIRTTALLVASALLSACVPYPVLKTLQPSARMTVVNQENVAVQKAEVSLIANVHVSAYESRRTKETGVDGTVTFDTVREWRVETTMLHGAEDFYWYWCVKKDGYVTQIVRNINNDDFNDKPLVRLLPGASSPCPARGPVRAEVPA